MTCPHMTLRTSFSYDEWRRCQRLVKRKIVVQAYYTYLILLFIIIIIFVPIDCLVQNNALCNFLQRVARNCKQEEQLMYISLRALMSHHIIT